VIHVERPGAKIYRGDYIADSARIGRGTKICAGHDIGKDVEIGEDCLIECQVSIPNKTKIGDRVFIGPGVHMANDRYPHIHGLHATDDSHLEPPIIEDDVTIGLGSLIGAGVRIGKGAFIAQGSNVVKDVAPYTAVMGNPAKLFDKIDPETRRFMQWEPPKSVMRETRPW
jgi:UDP-2-acetamido-3-amino-2,3-dideoxy-glucuronate N-acetyltransferase